MSPVLIAKNVYRLCTTTYTYNRKTENVIVENSTLDRYVGFSLVSLLFLLSLFYSIFDTVMHNIFQLYSLIWCFRGKVHKYSITIQSQEILLLRFQVVSSQVAMHCSNFGWDFTYRCGDLHTQLLTDNNNNISRQFKASQCIEFYDIVCGFICLILIVFTLFISTKSQQMWHEHNAWMNRNDRR